MEFSDRIPEPPPRSAALNRTIAVIAAAIMLLRVAHAMFLFNNTVDEPFHIASAVVMYDVGKESSGVEQPPLTRIVAGLPLYLRGVRLPPNEITTAVVPMRDTYLQGTQVLFHSNLSYWQVLRTARLSMLIFPLVALLYLYLLAAWIGNEFIAAMSVVFFSLDPAFIGHSAWVANDVAACAGYLAATYHGLRWVILGGLGRAAAMGIAVGAAIAAKFSCIFVLPALVLVMMIQPLSAYRASCRKRCGLIFVVGPRRADGSGGCGRICHSLGHLFLQRGPDEQPDHVYRRSVGLSAPSLAHPQCGGSDAQL